MKTHAKRQLVAAVEALAQHRPFFTAKLSANLLDAFLNPGKRPATSGARAVSA